MDAEMNRKLSAVSPEEVETDTVKQEYGERMKKENGFENFKGNDPKIRHIRELGQRIARTDFPVLITGETGTGKEVIARAIHMESGRSEEPFVAINCGAIPAELLDSELFGYEGGSFTGAKRQGKIGKFEMANKGTFFLGEIGDMPLYMQVKLLRVLQEKAFNDHYTAKKTGPEYIGLNQALKTHPQVKLLNGSYVIDDELQIYSHVTGEIYETNKNLLKEDKTRDDFVHEQHLLIQGRKNVLLMGCGHKGVLNIIRQCPAAPDIVIGGFHLYSPRTGECLPEPVIMDLAANLPDAVYYTGHCTGDKALEILTRELREIHPLMTGTVIEA